MRGLAGAQGLKGDHGQTGVKGDKGDLVPQGMEGPRSTQGLRGPQGSQGPQWGQGSQGAFSPTHTDLDMDNNKISMLSTYAHDLESATNVDCMTDKLSIAKQELTLALTNDYEKKTKSHSRSTNKKDVFRYIMEDADKSSSEYNIIDGIRFLLLPTISIKKITASKWGKGHKIGLFPTLPSTCSNVRRVSTLW